MPDGNGVEARSHIRPRKMMRAALKILNWRHQYHVMSKLIGTPLVGLPIRSVDFREMYLHLKTFSRTHLS